VYQHNKLRVVIPSVRSNHQIAVIFNIYIKSNYLPCFANRFTKTKNSLKNTVNKPPVDANYIQKNKLKIVADLLKKLLFWQMLSFAFYRNQQEPIAPGNIFPHSGCSCRSLSSTAFASLVHKCGNKQQNPYRCQ
jgi:hypothetical protein